MGLRPETPHLQDALLHAFAAGELDTVQKSTVEEHLAACADCRRAAARVSALVATLRSAPTPDLDELSWQRMSNHVRSTLARDAANARPVRRVGGSGGRSALAITGVAGLAATVFAAIWLARTPSPARDESVPSRPVGEIARGGSRERVIDRRISVVLSDDARLRATATSSAVDLHLDLGLVDVRRGTDDPSRTLTVWTPAFHAVARSDDFAIAYRASEASVEVREGEVEVRGSGASDGTVRRGERRVIRAHRVSEPPAATIEPSAATTHESKSLADRVRRDVAVHEEPAPPVRSSSLGETRVSIEPPADPLARQWLEASEAYYQRRDLARAIEVARQIVASGRPRPEVALAEELLCDAYVAKQEPQAAVGACQAVLRRAEAAGLEERARAIHYQLATIHRVQLRDCANAMYHYGRAIVFGRTSVLDDEALFWRASCAIELADLDAARRDLALLEQHRLGTAREEALHELEQRFDALIQSHAEPGSRARMQ